MLHIMILKKTKLTIKFQYFTIDKEKCFINKRGSLKSIL